VGFNRRITQMLFNNISFRNAFINFYCFKRLEKRGGMGEKRKIPKRVFLLIV
jgi:hypothetical protein